MAEALVSEIHGALLNPKTDRKSNIVSIGGYVFVMYDLRSVILFTGQTRSDIVRGIELKAGASDENKVPPCTISQAFPVGKRWSKKSNYSWS